VSLSNRRDATEPSASVVSRPWIVSAVVVGIAAMAALILSRDALAASRRSGPSRTQIRRLFLSDCAVCHGSSGQGTARGVSLKGVGRASIDYELTTGRMPLVAAGRSDQPGRPIQPLPDDALGDPEEVPRRHHPAYSPATIRALVDYVSQLTGGGGPDIPVLRGGDVAAGGVAFRLQCAACHAWAGDGGALLHREAPSLQSATPTQIAEAVRVGPGQMPAFGTAALDDRQLDSVVGYVLYLRQPNDRGGEPLWHLGPVVEGAVALLSIGGLLVLTNWIGDRG
jgi:ubiquinol-cytochrome c reductase cytochrome c subunit